VTFHHGVRSANRPALGLWLFLAGCASHRTLESDACNIQPIIVAAQPPHFEAHPAFA